MNNKLLKDITAELKTLEDQGLSRQVTDLKFTDAVWATDNQNKRYYVLSSNNYLGLTHAPQVIAAAAEACQLGTGSTGSRLVTGGTPQARQLELQLAKFKHAQEALIFNTGYMTNLGVLYALAHKGDYIFSDSLNHASIIDGCRISGATVVVYRHNDMEHLEELLQNCPPDKGARFIVTDGVFSMDGDICDLPGLVRLKHQYQACLMVDDAHAAGVIGPHGGGTADYYGLYGEIDLQIGTLSKALGSVGGYVAGDSAYISYLRNKSRPFIFATALPASCLAAATAALTLLMEQGDSYLNRLRRNTAYTRIYLQQAGIPVIAGETPIIPIMVGEAAKAVAIYQRLTASGILLSAIRPPTVAPGSSRLRLTVTAPMELSDLQQALALVVKVYKEELPDA